MMNSVTNWLEIAAKKYKDKIAFVDHEKTITFEELRKKAKQIAFELIDAGLFRQPVIVAIPKSIDEIVAFLGVAYSGNFYTPLDMNAPVDRINRVIDILKPKAIITRDNEEKKDYILNNIVIINYDSAIKKEISYGLVDERTKKVIDKDLLYVLFTSGSTGLPKGVMISHRSVINYIEWISEFTNIKEDDVIGNEAPLYFDLSIQDVYAPLKTGCRCVLLDKSLFSFVGSLMKRMNEQKINKLFWVPTALCVVANMKGLNSKYLPMIDSVSFCGEVMPSKQLNKWMDKFPNARFFNLYGPTEACDACMGYEITRHFEDDEIIPIGTPALNTDIMLIDEKGDFINDFFQVGEICIRGSALSYGYYNDDEDTKKHFEKRIIGTYTFDTVYHTGDLGKYNEKGELLFLGRKDFQIKHLGHRIELGDIEMAAIAIDKVEMAVAVYDYDKSKILLFCTGQIMACEVLKNIKNRIPSYMIPSNIVVVKKMFFNSNGKIDRKILLNAYKEREKDLHINDQI